MDYKKFRYIKMNLSGTDKANPSSRGELVESDSVLGTFFKIERFASSVTVKSKDEEVSVGAKEGDTIVTFVVSTDNGRDNGIAIISSEGKCKVAALQKTHVYSKSKLRKNVLKYVIKESTDFRNIYDLFLQEKLLQEDAVATRDKIIVKKPKGKTKRNQTELKEKEKKSKEPKTEVLDPDPEVIPDPEVKPEPEVVPEPEPDPEVVPEPEPTPEVTYTDDLHKEENKQELIEYVQHILSNRAKQKPIDIQGETVDFSGSTTVMTISSDEFTKNKSNYSIGSLVIIGDEEGDEGSIVKGYYKFGILSNSTLEFNGSFLGTNSFGVMTLSDNSEGGGTLNLGTYSEFGLDYEYVNGGKIFSKRAAQSKDVNDYLNVVFSESSKTSVSMDLQKQQTFPEYTDGVLTEISIDFEILVSFSVKNSIHAENLEFSNIKATISVYDFDDMFLFLTQGEMQELKKVLPK